MLKKTFVVKLEKFFTNIFADKLLLSIKIVKINKSSFFDKLSFLAISIFFEIDKLLFFDKLLLSIKIAEIDKSLFSTILVKIDIVDKLLFSTTIVKQEKFFVVEKVFSNTSLSTRILVEIDNSLLLFLFFFSSLFYLITVYRLSRLSTSFSHRFSTLSTIFLLLSFRRR